jgi:hypothetical protein
MSNQIFLGSLIHPIKKYCIPSWADMIGELKGINEVLLINTSDDPKFTQYTQKLGFPVVHLSGNNMFHGISQGRLELFRRFLASSNTHFFSLECDMFSEPEVPETLLRYEKEIVSVPYVLGYTYETSRRLKTDYLISITNESRIHYTLQELLDGSNGAPIVEINEGGLGCALMAKSVIAQYLPVATVSNERCDDQAFYKFCRSSSIPRHASIELMPKVKHYPHFHMNYGVYAQHLQRKGLKNLAMREGSSVD